VPCTSPTTENMLRNAASGRSKWVSQRTGGAFEEMAQTWEILADLHELRRKLKSSGVLLSPGATLS
jgi:hypothetical protein